MEEKKSFLSTLVILLSIIIVVLAGFIIYDKVLKKENNSSDKAPYHKIDETKGTYYVQMEDKYQLFYNKDVYEGKAFSEDGLEKLENEVMDMSYPVINIDTLSVKSINSKIKEIYDESIALNLDENDHNSCICIKKDNKVMCGSHGIESSYKVKETDRFITVIIEQQYYTQCASSNYKMNIFTIDKKDGHELSNKEIAKYFEYDEKKIYDDVVKYLKQELISDESFYDSTFKDGYALLIEDDLLKIKYFAIDGEDTIKYDDVLSYNNSVNVNS